MLLGDGSVSAVELRTSFAGEPLAMLAIHTFPPVSGIGAGRRDAMLADAADWAKRQASHAIIVGDLNVTPWSHAFHKLVGDSGLVDSERGFGVQPTWPSGLAPLAIPIDHLLHTSSLATTRRNRGPFLGSDHRPLSLELTLAAGH